ncbi:MAG: glycosyltransferase [Bacteroidales bacterium]|nr:glycosyltransferase [Candidatus Colimorpha onthohippi]
MNFSFVFAETYNIVLLSVAVVTLIYLFVYYGVTFMRVSRKQRQQESSSKYHNLQPEVSIVVVASSQANLLREHLVQLLEQTYPTFEVVVVDYQSHDDTPFVLKVLSAQYPNLKCVRMSEDINLFQSRLYPLSIGIRSAKYDTIVLVEPACVPSDKNWLTALMGGYRSDDDKIVLGYTHLNVRKGLLGCLEKYDNLVYHCSFLSAASLNVPYTGCGWNLSYRRSFFFDRGAFIQFYDEADEADDLFVNHNANKHNTNYVITNKSMMQVSAPETFKEWHLLRRHRIATRKLYSSWRSTYISLTPLMTILFYAACVMMFVNNLTIPWVIPVALLLIKFLWQIVCVAQVSKSFSLGNIHWAAPLLELYFIIANIILPLTPIKTKRRFV